MLPILLGLELPIFPTWQLFLRIYLYDKFHMYFEIETSSESCSIDDNANIDIDNMFKIPFESVQIEGSITNELKRQFLIGPFFLSVWNSN